MGSSRLSRAGKKWVEWKKSKNPLKKIKMCYLCDKNPVRLFEGTLKYDIYCHRCSNSLELCYFFNKWSDRYPY